MLHDDFKIQNMGGPKLKKFKGHYKLTLKNAKTGAVEKQVEGDNIVTSALPDLIERCNELGCLDYNKVLPIRDKWFGGCLLYQDPFPVDENEEIDPDDYFIKNNSVNPVMAHAGDTFTSDIRDDPKRGMPNTYLQEKTPKSCTMAWQWGPTQGNGQISAVALTHVDVGNCGTGSNSNAFKTLEPFIFANTASIGEFPYDELHSGYSQVTWRTLGNLDGHWRFDGWVGNSSQQYAELRGQEFDHYRFTLIFRRIAFHEAGLKDTNIPTSKKYGTTIHNANFNWNSQSFSYCWDKKHMNLWVFANDSGNAHQNHFWGAKFHISWNSERSRWDANAEYFDWYPNEDIIGDLKSESGYKLPHQCKYLEGGGYQDIVYFPYYNANTRSTDNHKKVKYNLQNQADYSVARINSDVSVYLLNSIPDSFAGKTSDDILVTKSYVMNNGIGYKCKYVESTVTYPNTLDTASIATLCPGRPNYILIDKLVCTTKANLTGGAVMKTAAQTMELEYTITEIEEN